MKKLVLVLLVCLYCLSGMAARESWAQIKGKMTDNKSKTISLYEVRDGVVAECAHCNVSPDGSFGFLFQPSYEGFYTLGSSWQSHPIYVKNGEVIQVEMAKEQLLFGKDNSKENRTLGEWEALAFLVRSKAEGFMSQRLSTYKDFFPEFEKLQAAVPAFKAQVRTSNKKFNEVLLRKIDYDLDYYAMNLLYTPRIAHPKVEDRSAFYQTVVTKAKFADDFILTMPYGAALLRECSMYVMGNKGTMADMLDMLGTERLKGEFVLLQAKRFKSYMEHQDMMKEYGRYFVTASLKQRADELGRKLFEKNPGGMAIDFTYPDMDGKMVSLSDFKGKVVVVDVWATWCGPCKQQIPHLKKLEEELHGKDVVFIGVTMDVKKDQEKWKKMVKDEQLGGIHLFGDGFSKIAKDYKITGIPRFMVFGKKGNVVSADAPRPSQPALKKMIEAELAK